AVPLGPRMLPYGRADVAEPGAHACRVDTQCKRATGRVDEPLVGGVRRTDDEADRSITAPAAQECAEVDAHQVSVGEPVVTGDPVHDGVVDARADDTAERARRPLRVVAVERRG